MAWKVNNFKVLTKEKYLYLKYFIVNSCFCMPSFYIGLLPRRPQNKMTLNITIVKTILAYKKKNIVTKKVPGELLLKVKKVMITGAISEPSKNVCVWN